MIKCPCSSFSYISATSTSIPTALSPLGAALVKWPKYFFLLITMKLASLVEIALLIIYHQGTKKNFDRKVLVFCTTCRKISI